MHPINSGTSQPLGNRTPDTRTTPSTSDTRPVSRGGVSVNQGLGQHARRVMHSPGRFLKPSDFNYTSTRQKDHVKGRQTLLGSSEPRHEARTPAIERKIHVGASISLDGGRIQAKYIETVHGQQSSSPGSARASTQYALVSAVDENSQKRLKALARTPDSPVREISSSQVSLPYSTKKFLQGQGEPPLDQLEIVKADALLGIERAGVRMKGAQLPQAGAPGAAQPDVGAPASAHRRVPTFSLGTLTQISRRLTQALSRPRTLPQAQIELTLTHPANPSSPANRLNVTDFPGNGGKATVERGAHLLLDSKLNIPARFIDTLDSTFGKVDGTDDGINDGILVCPSNNAASAQLESLAAQPGSSEALKKWDGRTSDLNEAAKAIVKNAGARNLYMVNVSKVAILKAQPEGTAATVRTTSPTVSTTTATPTVAQTGTPPDTTKPNGPVSRSSVSTPAPGNGPTVNHDQDDGPDLPTDTKSHPNTRPRTEEQLRSGPGAPSHDSLLAYTRKTEAGRQDTETASPDHEQDGKGTSVQGTTEPSSVYPPASWVWKEAHLAFVTPTTSQPTASAPPDTKGAPVAADPSLQATQASENVQTDSKVSSHSIARTAAEIGWTINTTPLEPGVRITRDMINFDELAAPEHRLHPGARINLTVEEPKRSIFGRKSNQISTTLIEVMFTRSGIKGQIGVIPDKNDKRARALLDKIGRLDSDQRTTLLDPEKYSAVVVSNPIPKA